MRARAIRTTSSQKSRERINPGLMIQHRTRTLWIACWSVWTLLDVATARLGGSPVNASNAFDAPSDGLFESDLSSVEEEPGQTGRLVERRVDEVFCDHQDEDEIEVLIGYTSEKGRSRAKDMAARHGASGRSAHGRDRGEKEKDFAEIRAIAITTTKKDMKELELDEDIEYIEPDRELHMLANVVPYGIQMTQGSDRRVPRPANPANAGNCNNPSALRVAIIDSGIDGSHPDLPCSRNSGARCVGRSFVSDSWNNDLNSHGKGILDRHGRCQRKNYFPHLLHVFRHPRGGHHSSARTQRTRRTRHGCRRWHMLGHRTSLPELGGWREFFVHSQRHSMGCGSTGRQGGIHESRRTWIQHDGGSILPGPLVLWGHCRSSCWQQREQPILLSRIIRQRGQRSGRRLESQSSPILAVQQSNRFVGSWSGHSIHNSFDVWWLINVNGSWTGARSIGKDEVLSESNIP
jgi:hypothetical protein